LPKEQIPVNLTSQKSTSQLLSFSEGDCTILLAQTAIAHPSPDLPLSVAAFTNIVYAE
jgi:hypothetical protein